MVKQRSTLPNHVEQSIEAIAELHASHLKRSTTFQRIVNLTVSSVGQPRSLIILTLFVSMWVAANIFAQVFGYKQIDAPPFQWLELGCSFVALYMTILILITQRHDDEIGEHREQLTLQLSILNEKKTAKIIALLEELRRDSPNVADRADRSAEAMAEPEDPQSILKALSQSQRQP